MPLRSPAHCQSGSSDDPEEPTPIKTVYCDKLSANGIFYAQVGTNATMHCCVLTEGHEGQLQGAG